MYNAMMDPEIIRITQQQMSRMSPAEFAWIQQQIAELGEKMASAAREEIAAMRACADALIKYKLSGAEMLKKQGNKLHNQRKFHEAMHKYCCAKQNIREIPSSQGRKLLLACSLNLMSCYLKTEQYDECVKEGSEVLAYDSKNLKAIFRRGQAYKELGLLKDAVNDLSMVYEACPDNDTVAKLLRETKELLAENGREHALTGLVVEEITDEGQNVLAQSSGSSSVEQTVAQPKAFKEASMSSSRVVNENLKSNMEGLNALKNDPEDISKMPPEELQNMFEMASSLSGKASSSSAAVDKNVRIASLSNIPSSDASGSNAFAADQLKHTRPEQMAEIGEKMANATPEEIAAMRARAEAQFKYELSGAEMLKKQGNELHNWGKFDEAMQKYCLAKQNIREIPSSQSRKLLLACSLNLMSCYLKTGQYDECVKEGSGVLAYDSKNLKALYRRGQAYKELGLLNDAVNDLSMVYEVCPDDDTVAKLLRETKELLAEDGREHVPTGLVVEEITEEGQNVPAQNSGSSSVEQTVAQPKASKEPSKSCSTVINENLKSNMEGLNALKNDPEAIRSFENFISNADPTTLASLNAGQSKDLSPDMIRTASNMISQMSPQELQKMLDMASSYQGDSPVLRGSPDSTINSGSIPPNVTPDMFKTASDMISKMPPEELQKMFKMASSMSGKASSSSSAAVDKNVRNASQSNIPSSNASGSNAFAESSSSQDSFLNMRNAAQSNFASSSTDLQEQMRNQMKDPATRQMSTSLIKNMSPEMMANMGEQFGVKLSKEDAAKAQQAMSSLLPEDLDRMMRWADRIQRGVEGAKKTKNWLLGKPGMILAIVMLILAVILDRLGFTGG